MSNTLTIIAMVVSGLIILGQQIWVFLLKRKINSLYAMGDEMACVIMRMALADYDVKVEDNKVSIIEKPKETPEA